MKRKRILHVAECAGGVSRYLQCLLKYLDHDKYENILLCSQNYKLSDFEGIAYHVEIMQMEHGVGLHDLMTAAEVRQAIKKYNPDIVYAHSSKAGALVRMANMRLKNKCVYNPHGWAFNMQGKKQMVYTIIEKIMAPFCDEIVCISDAEKQSALKKKICSEKKLNVIFNGVDVKAYEENKGVVSLDIPEGAFVVGMVGRLSLQKAPDMFIRMADKIKAQVPDAHFIIVGDGELQEEVEAYAKEHDIPIHITGWVSNPLDYVALFDVAVLLSRWEGFGLAIPEYMICGKPVVANAIDAIPNLLKDHENGILVPMDNPEAASEAVMEIYNDKELRDRLIAQGLKDVHEKYDVRRTAREHGELFESM